MRIAIVPIPAAFCSYRQRPARLRLSALTVRAKGFIPMPRCRQLRKPCVEAKGPVMPVRPVIEVNRLFGKSPPDRRVARPRMRITPSR